MNKTIFKIFSVFILSAAVIATLLLVINFIGFAIVGSNTDYNRNMSPTHVLSSISENLIQTNGSFSLPDKSILPPGYWCILIAQNGDVIWSEKKPDEIPSHYTINDIAQMSRWFLKDYPVYVQTEDYGLIVLGLPKNSLGKYTMEYSMHWFDTLPQRILGVFLLNLFLAALFALIFGLKLYRRLKRLMNGINDLRREKTVTLKEKGIFKELSRNLNETSRVIERKNTALSLRDNARSNWIAGISHDIRTPLSVITGYTEALSSCQELSEENRHKAKVILTNSIKIKHMIEDLNLISSMEYDMQPVKKVPLRLCPLLRDVVCDILNNGLSEKYTITLDLHAEKAVVLGDKSLLERAVFNLINNAVGHNENGCDIQITEDIVQNDAKIIISDNGAGVPDEVLAHITQIPKTVHGLGLPMAYKIINVHGGSFHAYNHNGFTVEISLPLQ